MHVYPWVHFLRSWRSPSCISTGRLSNPRLKLARRNLGTGIPRSSKSKTPASESPSSALPKTWLSLSFYAERCCFWFGLVSSFAILHMKNPAALTMKDRIAKVSTRIQGVRWDKGKDNHAGWVNCTISPLTQPRNPNKKSNSPMTLTKTMNLSRIFVIFNISFHVGI